MKNRAEVVSITGDIREIDPGWHFVTIKAIIGNKMVFQLSKKEDIRTNSEKGFASKKFHNLLKAFGRTVDDLPAATLSQMCEEYIDESVFAHAYEIKGVVDVHDFSRTAPIGRP